MKVKVNSELIKSNRLQHAWSQEELAHLSGLSLRTIQRIEVKGTSSLESVKAISSVLKVPLDEILLHSNVQKSKIINKLTITGFIATILAAFSMFFGSAVLAEQVMMEMDVSVNNEVVGHFSGMPVDEGEGKEGIFIFEELVKVLLVSNITESGELLVSTEIFEFDGAEYQFVSKPKALFSKEGDGAIQASSETGAIYRISFTSKIQ